MTSEVFKTFEVCAKQKDGKRLQTPKVMLKKVCCALR